MNIAAKRPLDKHGRPADTTGTPISGARQGGANPRHHLSPKTQAGVISRNLHKGLIN